MQKWQVAVLIVGAVAAVLTALKIVFLDVGGLILKRLHEKQIKKDDDQIVREVEHSENTLGKVYQAIDPRKLELARSACLRGRLTPVPGTIDKFTLPNANVSKQQI